MAFEVTIWEDSSNITISNWGKSAVMYWATDWGDMRRQGQTLGSRLGISYSSCLMDFLILVLLMAL